MHVIVGIVLLVLFVVTVGKLCGRLLGVRLGRVRGAIVGFIGWLAGAAATVVILGDADSDGVTLEIEGFEETLLSVALVLFFGALAAMPVAITLDLLTRGEPRHKGRKGRGNPLLHPGRAVNEALAPYGRLREVAGHARRHNLLHLRYASRAALESPDLSRRVRDVLEDSGGILVKFGQVASTRTDILPSALTTELATLRADVRPVPAEGIRAVLEEELGEPVEQAFASFEWEPLAAASIGQTHRATLADGTRVVVKVQRPGIAEVVARDAAVLRLASRQLERRVDAARQIHLSALSEELIAGVREELDYGHEAQVGTRLRAARAGDEGIAVPAVHRTLSTGRVLVMEEVVGASIADQEAVDAVPVPRPEIARRILASFLGQILDDGTYHADPHPGNLMIDPEGTVWLLDFGAVGRLDGRALQGLRGIAIGVSLRDASVLARAARDLAGDSGTADLRALEADMTTQLAQLAEAGGIDPRFIGQVLSVMQRHGLRPPRSMTILARALLTLEGTLRGIAPTFSLQTASREVVLADHQDAFGTPEDLLKQELVRMMPSLRTLPEHAETLADQLRSGNLTVRTERYAGGDRDVVESWVDRIALAIVGGCGALASGLLFLAAVNTDGDLRTTLLILGFAGMTAANVLLMRVAARALRRQGGRIG